MTTKRSSAVERQRGNVLVEDHFYFHKATDVLAIRRVGRAALSRVHVEQELPF